MANEEKPITPEQIEAMGNAEWEQYQAQNEDMMLPKSIYLAGFTAGFDKGVTMSLVTMLKHMQKQQNR